VADSQKPLNTVVLFGTRPEAIKMAPVVLLLRNDPRFRLTVVSTSQHRQMLDQVLDLFGIRPDIDLNIMQPNQTLNQIAESAVHGFRQVLEELRPELVLVQGDTTTAFIGALTAFYAAIPVGHIEAGLRTFNLFSPYPEEANRRMISNVASYHFAPTEGNRQNLLQEGMEDARIAVTGNTVIDALHWVLQHKPDQNFVDSLCARGHRLILVTAHRRENFGAPIRRICSALRALVESHPDIEVVYPVHLNQNIQSPVNEILSGIERLHLIQPVDYRRLAALLNRSYLILTDSGGIQEEGPSLGKPVLVMRDETERPEAVQAGTVRLVGTDLHRILAETDRLLNDPAVYEEMARAQNPYGDGHAAERIADYLATAFRLTNHFVPM